MWIVVNGQQAFGKAVLDALVPGLRSHLEEITMIITINDDWRLASDPLQWVLQKRNPNATDEKNRWRSVGCFGRFDGAVVECSRRRIRILPGVYGPEALKPLSDALTRIERDIHAALEGFQIEAAAYHGRAGS